MYQRMYPHDWLTLVPTHSFASYQPSIIRDSQRRGPNTALSGICDMYKREYLADDCRARIIDSYEKNNELLKIFSLAANVRGSEVGPTLQPMTHVQPDHAITSRLILHLVDLPTRYP